MSLLRCLHVVVHPVGGALESPASPARSAGPEGGGIVASAEHPAASANSPGASRAVTARGCDEDDCAVCEAEGRTEALLALVGPCEH